jgi:hypothetical protein
MLISTKLYIAVVDADVRSCHDRAPLMVALAPETLHERELSRYVARVSDRWPLVAALLGGARVEDARGAGLQRERGEEYVVVLVSEAFDGVPWLERVYQAGALWDAGEMGARPDMHCYTPVEFERKREALASVRAVVTRGVDMQAPLAPQLTPLAPVRVEDEPPYSAV